MQEVTLKIDLLQRKAIRMPRICACCCRGVASEDEQKVFSAWAAGSGAHGSGLNFYQTLAFPYCASCVSHAEWYLGGEAKGFLKSTWYVLPLAMFVGSVLCSMVVLGASVAVGFSLDPKDPRGLLPVLGGLALGAIVAAVWLRKTLERKRPGPLDGHAAVKDWAVELARLDMGLGQLRVKLASDTFAAAFREANHDILR
jgi:hypothetical protein